MPTSTPSMRSRLRRSDGLSTTASRSVGRRPAGSARRGRLALGRDAGHRIGAAPGSSSPSGRASGDAQRRLLGLLGRQPGGRVVGGLRGSLMAGALPGVRPPRPAARRPAR